jgi:hypothetical protein
MHSVRRRTGAILLLVLPLLLAPALARISDASSSCGIDAAERIVAVGDAHGAYSRYVAILKVAGLIDEQLRWSGGHTHFVQTGDLLDRGPESKQILDLLVKLEPEASAAGGAVHVLLGNHEVMRMLGDMRYVSAAEYQAFATPQSEDLRRRYAESASSPEAKTAIEAFPLGSIEMRLAFGPNGTYGKWLRTLDTVATINHVLFVHGGISPTVAPTPCTEINDTVRRELTSEFDATLDNPLKALAAREDGPLWYRGLAQEPDEFAPSVTAILDAQNVRAIVVGHTPTTTRRIRERFNGTVFQIDTGMLQSYVPDGHASALEIKDGHFTAIYEDSRVPLESHALLVEK